MQVSYGIDDIKSLDFRQGVRQRIQMYLGSDDIEGTYQGFKEIINNSTDEALAGYGKLIEIGVDEKKNFISVRDYGRGVPFGIKTDGENVLVSIFSKSHTGGKFDNKAYKNASGLNGIGAKCVCLSSEKFKVESYRNGIAAVATFDKGVCQSYNETKTEQENGTLIEFIPDKEVFKNGEIGYNFNRICDDIKNISYLNSGVTFKITNLLTSEIKSYCAKNGIIDFIKDTVKTPLHSHIIHEEVELNGDKLEIAFQWGTKREQSYVFVNGLLCPEGGVPITGAKQAITRTFNSLAKENFEGENIRQYLCYVINCSVANPSFANQTKSKINNAELRQMASSCFSASLKKMKNNYKDEFETIVNIVRKLTKAELAAERERQKFLNAEKEIERNQKKKVFSSNKLKDAEFLGEDSILLICEGDSALGAMAQARDVRKYGLMGIKGKIINCLSNPEEKIYQNEEIKLLLSAMNIVPGKYNSKKLRYGKIAICTDADSDGSHIGLLIMAALRYLAPQFIEENRLCWLRSPLYIVKNGKKEDYYFSDDEYDRAKDKIKGEVNRAKGLGALSPEQARRSMFTDEFQRMDTLVVTSAAIELLDKLMGESAEYRREYMFNKIDFSTIRE